MFSNLIPSSCDILTHILPCVSCLTSISTFMFFSLSCFLSYSFPTAFASNLAKSSVHILTLKKNGLNSAFPHVLLIDRSTCVTWLKFPDTQHEKIWVSAFSNAAKLELLRLKFFMWVFASGCLSLRSSSKKVSLLWVVFGMLIANSCPKTLLVSGMRLVQG